MPHRSPARFLAPVALLAAIVTIFLVARPELGGSAGGESDSKKATTSQTSTTASERKRAAPKAAPKTYTVKPGDVLGSISESTGVAVEDLLDYNDIDAQSLSVGQKLKLTP